MRYVTRIKRVWRLTAPLAYWQIRHSEKRKYDVLYPAIFSVVTVGGYLLLPVRPSLIGEKGILISVQNLLTLLIPFFVAGLAAVATAGREGLDTVTAGIPMQLGKRSLTRREFVCYMFGYLAWISLVLFAMIIVAKAIAPSLHQAVPIYMPYVRIVSFAVFMFLLGHMIVTTLWGLFYLTDRINRE